MAILMTTGLVLPSTRAATKAELAAAQQKRNAEALAKMTIKEVAPTKAAIAAMKTLKAKEWTVPTLAMKMNHKVIRGGAIGTAPRFLRSAARYAVPRDTDYYGMLGLRLVLAPKVEVEIE